MKKELQGKKAILLDLGWTLEYPASGDWIVTNKMREIVGEQRLAAIPPQEMADAQAAGMEWLLAHHTVHTLAEETEQFTIFYGMLNALCGLGLSQRELHLLACDHCSNMDNFCFFEDARTTVEALAQQYRLGILSDTWPSAAMQLAKGGFTRCFESFTFSCDLGVCKPDERIYRRALDSLGVTAEETVFVDDLPKNLAGAQRLGITPIQADFQPTPAPASPYPHIRALRELIEE